MAYLPLPPPRKRRSLQEMQKDKRGFTCKYCGEYRPSSELASNRNFICKKCSRAVWAVSSGDRPVTKVKDFKPHRKGATKLPNED